MTLAKLRRWRREAPEEARRLVAYLTRVVLGRCPHEWRYETTRYPPTAFGPGATSSGQVIQSCRWCGLHSDQPGAR